MSFGIDMRVSMLMLEIEKLSILQKELRYLYLICDYYSGNNDTVSEKKDLEHTFTELKYQISDIYSSIKYGIDNIEKNLELIQKFTEKDILQIQFLIYIDIVRSYTKYKLKRLDIISIKISQLLRSGYNQYIPRPIAGKRYSNINITSEVELSLKNRLKELIVDESKKDIDIEIVIVWDYNDDYVIEKYIDKEDINLDNQKIKLTLNLSYWYFEFPYFLPNLTHELGHIIINEQNNNNYNVLKEAINSIDLEQFGFDRDDINTLSEEIIADLLSLVYHGDSYIFSFLHKKLGLNLHNLFKVNQDIYNRDNIIKLSNIDIQDSFLISPIRIDIKRDFIFIRFKILLYFREFYLKEYATNNKVNRFREENKKYINEIDNLLNSIYNLDNFNYKDSYSLNNIYENFHNYLEDYKNTFEFIKYLYNNIIGVIHKNKDILFNILNEQIDIFYNNKKESYLCKLLGINKKNDEKNSDLQIIEKLKIANVFSDIWAKRFKYLEESKQVMHRYEYRKKLHKNTLLKLYKNQLLPNEETLRPYSLSMVKFRVDKLSSYPTDIENSKINNSVIVSHGIVLGMYDYIILKKLDPKFIPTIKEKVTDLNHNFLNNKKYYESFFSLMKITKDISGQYKDNGFSSFIQIEVEKELKNTIYKNLFDDIKRLYNIIQNNKTYFKKVEIFKSLGPKDLIVHIDNTSLDGLYKIKEEIYNNFNRTYTTIYFKNFELIKCEQISYPFYFVSHLRMNPSKDKKINNFIEICKHETQIDNVYLETGILDYLISWKNKTTLEDLNNFYNKLLDNNLVYDIQTNIEKKVISN